MPLWNRPSSVGQTSLPGVPVQLDGAAVKASCDEERESVNRLQRYSYEHQYEACLKELIAFVDAHPDRRQFATFSAGTVLRSYLRDRAANTVSPIDDSILGAPQLAGAYLSCAKCSANWVPNPMDRIAGGGYMHSPGRPDLLKCPKCGKKSVRVGR